MKIPNSPAGTYSSDSDSLSECDVVELMTGGSGVGDGADGADGARYAPSLPHISYKVDMEMETEDALAARSDTASWTTDYDMEDNEEDEENYEEDDEEYYDEDDEEDEVEAEGEGEGEVEAEGESETDDSDEESMWGSDTGDHDYSHDPVATAMEAIKADARAEKAAKRAAKAAAKAGGTDANKFLKEAEDMLPFHMVEIVIVDRDKSDNIETNNGATAEHRRLIGGKRKRKFRPCPYGEALQHLCPRCRLNFRFAVTPPQEDFSTSDDSDCSLADEPRKQPAFLR